MSDSNQNLETICDPNSSLQNLKDFSSKGQLQKNYLVKNELCMQLTKQFQNFDVSAKDITSDYGFLLRLVNTFTVNTEEYPLLKVRGFTLCADKSYICILQFGSFEKKMLIQCCSYIMGSNQKDIKLYLVDPLHLQRANKLPKLNQSI